MKRFRPILLLLIVLSCSGCSPSAPTPTGPAVSPTELPGTPGILVAPAPPDLATHPLLKAYLAEVEQALKANPPILLLRNIDSQQAMAQTLALRDAQIQPWFFDETTGAALRNEVFGVVTLRASDLNSATAECQTAACYRVEIYNFARNEALNIVVNIDQQRVVQVTRLVHTQPDLPQHLVAIARELATEAPEVHQALGLEPSTDDALMAETKTSLNGTRCERSEHLCVAPTFISGDQALWAIVDLTAGQLIGLRWTHVGVTGPAVTEKGLQNEVVLQYCERATRLERDGWSLDYMLTSSDGLRVADVTYQGAPVIANAKLVDWHVNYSNSDGFGYSDAVGCPFFSQAAVIAIGPPQIIDLREGDTVVGFSLVQNFWSELWPRPCSYYYTQEYSFYFDGRFRPAVASVGRGCGDDGTYRPVTRIALPGNATFSEWTGSGWKPWETEGWQGAEGRQIAPEGAEYRVSYDGGSGFLIETGRGQFGDGGRGDTAYVYLTRNHPDRDEGESDMTTIGPCCNTDEHQGPEKFIDATPEATLDAPLVLWYVAQLKNDDTPGEQYCWAESVLEQGVYSGVEYPCWSGPMFHPIAGGQS